MKKILKYSALLAVFICSNIVSGAERKVDPAVAAEVGTLARLISDQYSVYLDRSLAVRKFDGSKYAVATFSIEGFGQGNNVKRFLAVFVPEYKTESEPPFAPVGDPKYRLVGYTPICDKRHMVVDVASLQIKGRALTGSCKNYRNENLPLQKLDIELLPFGINVEG